MIHICTHSVLIASEESVAVELIHIEHSYLLCVLCNQMFSVSVCVLKM